MTLQEIKNALSEGKRVFWKSTSYEVIKDNIVHTGGHIIGLTWTDGVTLNGKEEDFFIKD